MTAIKHMLQREVFLPSEERLVAVVHVTKPGKKKKESYLCAAVTTEKPIQALVVQVKKSEKENFKKKFSWGLRQLKVLDAKYQSKDTPEFDLHFEKVYKWQCSSIAEKKAFISCLFKLSQRYLVQKPEFNNIPPGLIEDPNQVPGGESTSGQVDDITALGADTENWQALSTKEEEDMDVLMTKCDYAISNAEAFTEELTNQLSMLDGANIHSIMESEEQVLELMVLLDQGLQEAMKIEEKLDEYETKLQSVKELMDVMKDKDSIIQIRNRNLTKLHDDLDGLISQMDLDHNHMRALLDAELTSATGVAECTAAAQELQKCMAAEIHPSLMRMVAVQEQQKRFAKLKTAFSKRLAHHLNNLFIHQGNEMGGTLTLYARELRLPQHMSSHRDLLPYADLMHWLKVVDPESFEKLRKVYMSSLRKLYDHEVREFFENAKQKLGMTKFDRKGSLIPPQKGQSGSSSSLNKASEGKGLRSGSFDTDSQHGSELDLSGRVKFDQMFELLLSELAPWCLAEQDFSVRFFNLDSDSQEMDTLATSLTLTPVKGSPQRPTTAKQRKINEDIRKMMGELFPSLETELTNFVAFGISIDNFNSLYMLVRMGNHVINAEDTGSFLSKTFGTCLVQIKRNFDKFIQTQIGSIQESRLSKKSKVGIIPFVHSFEDFAHQAENIFKNTSRRTDLDKAYARLVSTIFSEINRLAAESMKTPREVVLFENYHHIHAVLSRLKISCLDAHKKEAKQRYQEHLLSYVVSCLGRPMEKLHTFFEGIEAKVASGVKEEEVGYQLAFSKQELRKVLREYPGKEVKRGLDHLIKKIEKQLCDEENLLQVVWHSMQEEFLKQYSQYETMISKCYPGSGIKMEFTISDLLAYFSDIAQSH
ncbi:hypothetical protein CAPTEDRAFT_229168 [Capitella teleta]|uniref:Exocyst complex component Sec3 PIP2-binding N-terminal domain-containing protein n=1 Tax=Capitella teleta TaxID=283909 RepID=R7T8G9_CAPTE|nr:hypothetical protein CAPTEDRAFT_229168 [Capitella teleta]|eukprot:ELT89930.1 hypothetical protein CAPTEDRAFT_229168 [Capitella teleta]